MILDEPIDVGKLVWKRAPYVPVNVSAPRRSVQQNAFISVT